MTKTALIRTAAFIATACCIANAFAASEFFTPAADKDGIKAESKTRQGLPNVLIIGDSISIGYTKTVIEELQGVANVKRVKENCGDTPRGLEKIDQWLGNTKWDVIHFNWGLWDLCYRHPDSKVQGNRDKVNGTQAVPPEQYEKNLEALVQRLEKTGAALIWASTTVVPEKEAGRFVGDDAKYNAIAAKVMKQHNVAIDDLHALSVTLKDQLTAPGNVHFKKAGYVTLGKQVADSIRTAIQSQQKE
ncbi:SGNH/GDSL hydrolase family protein [Pontiella sp.]|uniref:SGNH/GDSL hydrolase family protein n=1 Tax=Pontiella sp. TaxID=2837462 RepID=UPI003569569D